MRYRELSAEKPEKGIPPFTKGGQGGICFSTSKTNPPKSPFGKGGLYIVLVAFVVAMAQTQAMATETQEIVCIRCHSKLPEKYSQPVKLWRGSIHAENGIACNACHGGDPKDMDNAMSPTRGFLGAPKEKDIPAFCGRCHIGVMKDYLTSAHGKALGRGGPTCVTCHGNHQVVKATLGLINEKKCSSCHSFERARTIKNAMQDTEGLIVVIDARISEFKGQGFDTDLLGNNLFSLRNRFHTLFHNVDTEKVKQESGWINTELKKIDRVLQRLDDVRQKRKIAGALAVAGALLAGLLFHLLRKTFD